MVKKEISNSLFSGGKTKWMERDRRHCGGNIGGIGNKETEKTLALRMCTWEGGEVGADKEKERGHW